MAKKNTQNKGVRDESVVKSIPFASSYHVNVIIKLLFCYERLLKVQSISARMQKRKKNNFQLENAK